MGVLQRLIGVIASVALAAVLIAAGFFACLLPPVTSVLSNTFAKDGLSPFDRSQLVKVADATRDYSFGSHDELALYQAIFEIDSEYAQQLASKGGKPGTGFPEIGKVGDADDIVQLKEAFANASELYCFSEQTVSHLDDCYAIVTAVRPLLVAAAVVAAIGAALTAAMGSRRSLGGVLVAAALAAVGLLAALGAWAAIDFAGFFASFHHLFFSQGNWTFPYDSLLICALPTEFWMGMGIVWLAVTLLASILSLVIGLKLRKGRAAGAGKKRA